MAHLTKYIAKMPAIASPDLLGRLEQKTRGLALPSGYEGVVGDSVTTLPLNLLIFFRSTAAELSWSGSPIERNTYPHQHHRHVLIVALNGKGCVWIDSKGFMLEPGQAILVSPYQKHSYTEVSPAKFTWLFVTFEHARCELTESLRSRPASPLNRNALRALDDLLAAWQTDQRDSSNALLLALLLRWIAQEAPLRHRSRQTRHKSAISTLIGKINRLAFEHRNRAVTIEEAAARVGMSPSHLRSTFRRATGQSLGTHLRDFRLQYACSLLADKSRRLAEIAEACGYESQFTFSRAFRKAYGCPPRVYRSRLGESPADRLQAPHRKVRRLPTVLGNPY